MLLGGDKGKDIRKGVELHANEHSVVHKRTEIPAECIVCPKLVGTS